MSIPDFINRQEHVIVHSTRAGYRNWHNPYQDPEGAKQDVDDEPRPVSINGDEGDNDDEEDGVLDNTRRNEQEEQQDVPEPAKEGPVRSERDDATDLQILELHSNKPIFSYRGRVFTGSWSANIGTELLVTGRNADAPPLPALRKLSDRTDLVGNSAARIACAPAEVWPRPELTDGELVEQRVRNNFAIPIHSDVSGTRLPQAAFLERLMAIKTQRGETDWVTTKATESTLDDVVDDPGEEQQRKKRKRDKARSKARWATLHPPKKAPAGRVVAQKPSRYQAGPNVVSVSTTTPATLQGMIEAASRGGSS